MVVPEKIYIQPNTHDGWFEIKPNSDMFVEYVCKDVFIKNAEKYLTGKFIIYLRKDTPTFRWGRNCAFPFFINY